MNSKLVTLSIAFGFGLMVVPAFGQFYPPMTIDPSLTKFLDKESAFSATLEVTSRAAGYRWTVHMALFKGRTRVEMDISNLQQDQKDPIWVDYVANMKKAGSAESVSIFNPDMKSVLTVLPHLKAYTENPIPEDALAQIKKRPVAAKVELGTENIDNRVCLKTKVSFSKNAMDVWRTWETPEAFIWSPTNPPNVPLRIVVLGSEGQTNTMLIFKDVVLKKPDPGAFQPPRGFTKLDQNGLMKRIMEKWPQDK